MLKRVPETTWKHESPPEPWPQCPGANIAFLGPSGSGKTTTLVSMILGPYAHIFRSIHVFSPSAHIDSAWQPVKTHAMKLDGSSFHDHWDEAALHDILEKQRENIRRQKEKHTKVPLDQVLVVIDDMADDSRLHMSTNSALAALFARGRHLSCSCFVSTQKLTTLATVVRANLRYLLVWRLRNAKEIASLFDELSALYPVKVLQLFYEAATDKPYGFLYINLIAKSKDLMFYDGFEARLVYD